MERVGLVGSPSNTGVVTVDITEDAAAAPLHGQLVYLTHALGSSRLIAIGTITEISTSNRWHEDANMRGVLKRHGSLPHLSEIGDVRTAEVAIQAAYLAKSADLTKGDPPTEEGGALSMSPTTGSDVALVSDDFLSNLLRRHAKEVIYLGQIYRSKVKLPLRLRHFGPEAEGGSGESYHAGIFGMTGSGKSVLAAYFVAAYLRHPGMGVLIMDPQGQFTGEEGLPFSLEDWAMGQGRRVLKYSISRDLRLRKDASLFADLLGVTPFFRDSLTIKTSENRESAVAEFTRLLRAVVNWDERNPSDVLSEVLTALSNNQNALTRIYAGQQARNRLAGAIQGILNNEPDREVALESFGPVHNLFAPTNADGGQRMSLWGVLSQALNAQGTRPLVIIDFSGQGEDLLDSTSVKARLLRIVCSRLDKIASEQYREGRGLNTLVVFDEAQRFAAQEPEEEESRQLADKLVDYVRTTRKYGLGWMFITQETGSLKRGIYGQLRVRSFGYGLTSGSELQRLRDTIGDPAALEFYRSFVDPQAIQPPEYPFMLTGPVSPLSFTGAPVFLSVYTDFGKFCKANGLAPSRRT